MKYAYGIMNEAKTKQQIALESGFSYSTSRVPKSIENKLGFKLAVAQIAGETENVTMKLLFEIQARDLSKVSNGELIKMLGTMSNVCAVFNQKLYPIK